MLSRYSFTKPIDNLEGKKVLSSFKIPEIPDQEDDVYIITNVADRLDSLAFRFYGDAKYWWVIAVANDLGKGTLVIDAGTQLRIPANPSNVINIVRDNNT